VGGKLTIDLDRSIARTFSPRSWRRRTRRLFLLTLPISVPLWFALVAALGIGICLRDLTGPLVKFWNAPPKRMGGDPYMFDRSREGGRFIDIGENGTR